MNQIETISKKLNIAVRQVEAVAALLDQENTIPFVARYRKEVTGGLDETKLRQLADELERLRSLDKRRQSILASIARQGKLTPALERELNEVDAMSLLEDLYLPYKPKRSTRAGTARNKGLQGLADTILEQSESALKPQITAKSYLNDSVSTLEEALSGARDIAAEVISDHPRIREEVRNKAFRWAVMKVEKVKSAEDPTGIFQDYYSFQLRMDRLRPHQILAVNRGEKRKILRVQVEIPERDWRPVVDNYFPVHPRSAMAEQLIQAREDGARRLLLPAIERDVRKLLTESAEAHAIQVFASNLQGLLKQPPLAGYVVLGIDPGLRTGCKAAVVDATGSFLATDTFYLPEIKGSEMEAQAVLDKLASQYGVGLIAIGNGTGSRSCEQLVASYIQNRSSDLRYIIADEAGASVYSASALARDELPDLDVTLRGAVSIARRVQDPLAELVKIDPKSIGVGLYQHDVNQSQLDRALQAVVESIVNQVGVDLNTASMSLLTYVSGVGPKLAKNIVEYRDEHGPFPDRRSLLEIPGLGPKSFEQAAGFLRIQNGSNPFDASAIHPESYEKAVLILREARTSMKAAVEEREKALNTWRMGHSNEELAQSVGAGVPTLVDILEQLVRPGRDPREGLPLPILRKDVLSAADLKVGMVLKGTVRNVVDFGAFVDIGLKEAGLLHRSQWPRNFELNVGDVIETSILRIEPERNRIALGLKQ